MARKTTTGKKPLKGKMKHVRVFNKALSAAEVKELGRKSVIKDWKDKRVPHPLNPSLTATPKEAKAISKEMKALDKAMDKETDAIALDQEIAADAAAAAPAPDVLSRIITGGELVLLLRKNLADLNEQAEQVSKSIKTMEEVTLPAMFDEAGVKIIGLEDAEGHVMERGEDIYASISKANAEEAANWLIKNGYGSIVKAKVLVELEKGETGLLGIVREALGEKQIAFEESSAVNAATLKAFVKERLEAGTVLPKSISVHIQPRVTLKVPKKRVKK